jgi:hypothetical protein
LATAVGIRNIAPPFVTEKYKNAVARTPNIAATYHHARILRAVQLGVQD